MKKETHVNNLYAIKLMNQICKKRLIFMIISSLITYFEWLFLDVFFVRYLIVCIEDNKSLEDIIAFLIISCIIFGIIAICKSFYNSSIIPLTDVFVEKELYSILYEKARNVELECYENPDFYNKFTMALDNTSKRVVDAANTFINIFFGIFASIILIIVIILIEPITCLFVVFPLIGNFFVGKFMNKVYYGRYVDNSQNERVLHYVNRVMCLERYSKEMRYSAVYNVLLKKLKNAIKQKVDVMRKYGEAGTKYMSIKNILTFPLPFEGLMLYATYQTIIKGSMQLSDLAIIYSTMAATSWILIGIFNNIVEYMKNGINIGYIKEFLEYKEQISENQKGKIVSKEIECIEFQNVSFGYRNKEIIKDLSFCITSRENIAIVGRNGAGKSTIIKLLLRLYDPTKGCILVNGIDIREYDLRAYREMFSVAFQEHKVMGMSVRDNISMGEDIELTRIEKSVREVGLNSKIEKLKKGLNTILTKEFDNEGIVLSKGEQQKVVLARAFAKDSPIKIFDEPSSALDPLAEGEIYRYILKRTDAGINIFVSHRLSTVKRVDRILLIDKGELCEQGKHEDLIKRCSLYNKIYNSQARNYLAEN